MATSSLKSQILKLFDLFGILKATKGCLFVLFSADLNTRALNPLEMLPQSTKAAHAFPPSKNEDLMSETSYIEEYKEVSDPLAAHVVLVVVVVVAVVFVFGCCCCCCCCCSCYCSCCCSCSCHCRHRHRHCCCCCCCCWRRCCCCCCCCRCGISCHVN